MVMADRRIIMKSQKKVQLQLQHVLFWGYRLKPGFTLKKSKYLMKALMKLTIFQAQFYLG